MLKKKVKTSKWNSFGVPNDKRGEKTLNNFWVHFNQIWANASALWTVSANRTEGKCKTFNDDRMANARWAVGELTEKGKKNVSRTKTTSNFIS